MVLSAYDICLYILKEMKGRSKNRACKIKHAVDVLIFLLLITKATMKTGLSPIITTIFFS